MTARTEEYARLAAQGKTCAEIAKACGCQGPPYRCGQSGMASSCPTIDYLLRTPLT